MKKPAALFFFFCWCLQLLAQQATTVAASVDKASILIGEPLQLTLQATFSKPHTPVFFQIDTVPHFEIQYRSKIDTQVVSSKLVLRQTVTLTSWDSGAWAIPPLRLPGVRGVATTAVPVAVTFTPMPPNQDYHDIKDILEVQKPARTTWYWYVIGAILLLLLLLLMFPKKKREAMADATIAREGAYKQALKNLEALQHKSALDDKTYFTELIQIFRTYLQQRKGIHSFQQTTDDLSRQLQGLALPHGDLKMLVQTLQLSDFVKFARYTVAANERDEAWQEIRKSITAIEQSET